MTQNKKLLLVLAAVNIALLLVCVGVGLFMTAQYDRLVFGFQDAQTQRIVEAQVENDLWRNHAATVARVATDITRESEFRAAFDSRVPAELTKAMEESWRRGAITSGEVTLLGVTLLDTNLAVVGETWQGARGALPGGLKAKLTGREGPDRLKPALHAWNMADTPMMSVAGPIGGLRLLGYIVLHVNPLPVLKDMDSRLGMAMKVRDSKGGLLLELKNFKIPDGATTRDANLVIKNEQGQPLTRLDAVLDITALSSDLARTRLTSFLLFLVLGGILATGSLIGVRVFLARGERKEKEAEAELDAARQAEKQAHLDQAAAQTLAAEQRKREMERLAQDLHQDVDEVLRTISQTALSLQDGAKRMAAVADRTAQQADAVTRASEDTSRNVNGASNAATDLAEGIAQLAGQADESSQVAANAVEEVRRTNQTVEGLVEAASRIGQVVKLINDIAGQTNLLALNATIEAARAGDAGKGFAVVANEVKGLANQTAKATEEISAEISHMQQVTEGAAKAIQSIGATIGRIDAIAAAIAQAVERQDRATQEIAEDVQDAARGVRSVSDTIGDVSKAAGEVGATADDVLAAAERLSSDADNLKARMAAFEHRIAG